MLRKLPINLKGVNERKCMKMNVRKSKNERLKISVIHDRSRTLSVKCKQCRFINYSPGLNYNY